MFSLGNVWVSAGEKLFLPSFCISSRRYCIVTELSSHVQLQSGASQQDKSSQFQSQGKLIHISVGYFFMENVIDSIDCGTWLRVPRTGGPQNYFIIFLLTLSWECRCRTLCSADCCCWKCKVNCWCSGPGFDGFWVEEEGKHLFDQVWIQI